MSRTHNNNIIIILKLYNVRGPVGGAEVAPTTRFGTLYTSPGLIKRF